MTRAVLLLAAALAACSPKAVVAPEMGPMPVVAALYDADALPATPAQRAVFFSDDLAQGLTANAAGRNAIDFDYRSWAKAPDIEKLSFAIDEQATEGNRAGIVVRFTSPAVGGAMVVEHTLCRRENGDWRITEITGAPAGDDASARDTPASLRRLIGMPVEAGEGC